MRTPAAAYVGHGETPTDVRPRDDDADGLVRGARPSELSRGGRRLRRGFYCGGFSQI